MEQKRLAPVKKNGNFVLEELASMPSFYLMNLSHDEKKLAFYWDKTGRLELYVMDLETKKIKQVSDGQIPRAIRAGFIWSRDNEHILFNKDVDGDEKHDIYSININSREVKQLTHTPTAQDYIVHSSPDGKYYSIASNREGQLNLFTMSTDEFKVEQITAYDNPAFGGRFSPNSQYMIYSTNEEGDLKNQDIYLASSDGSSAERILQIKVGSSEGFSDWAEDSKSFAFTTDANGVYQGAIFNIETKKINYFGDAIKEEFAVKLTKDGKSLICLRAMDGSVSPIVYNIESGEIKELNFPKGIAAGGELKGDRYLFLTINTPNSPSSLVMYDLMNHESEILLETDPGNNDSKLFTDAKHFWYSSLDGTKIPAILYTPREFDPQLKYPAILYPHGGPTGQYLLNFSIAAQYYTDLGYVVLMPNVRGSTGYGVEFRDSCIKDWGGKDHDDWVAGRNWLIDNSSVDPDRVSVYGGSYGGYATMVCMTKSPDLWVAGAAAVPVTHLGKMYEKSMEHFKYYLRQQMGDPVKDKDLWEERSPLNYVENIKKPLLLIHGTNDPRCPVEESRNVRDRLLELGRTEGVDGDFEYIEYSDHGHGAATDIEGRIRWMKATSEFLYRRMT